LRQWAGIMQGWILPAKATGDARADEIQAGLSEGFASVLGMRFLHTSDWHLGRSLHRADLRAAQSGFLDHLVETARSENVDAVLVAGDVYDRAIPPVDAVELYEDALTRLRATGARVILISGNHDSARRLGVNSALIDASGVHLRTRPAALADPVILPGSDGEVAVYGVPYLEPALGLSAARVSETRVSETRVSETRVSETRVSETGVPDARVAEASASAARASEASPLEDGEATGLPRTHESVIGEALRRIRASAVTRGIARTIVMAHAWVAGGASDEERQRDAERAKSDSERDISVGGIGYVPASLFGGFSYVALGHLHGRRTLTENMRYSGSPLPYSFSERDHQKGSWLVEIGVHGEVSTEWVPAPVHKRLTVIQGRLDDLLTFREHDAHAGDFVAVTLTDTARPEGAMDKLRARFPYILTLEFKPEGVTQDKRSYGQKVKGRDDLTVAAEFVRHVRNTAASAPERELLEAAFAAAREGLER
jgi:DNA repair protein SbcD/Mre11